MPSDYSRVHRYSLLACLMAGLALAVIALPPTEAEAKRKVTGKQQVSKKRLRCKAVRQRAPRTRSTRKKGLCVTRKRRRRPAARPFARTSFWNTRLKAGAPLDARNATYVGQVRTQLTKWRPWINATQYSSPVYTVPRDQPTVRVMLDYRWAPDLQAAWDRVPIPAGARPADGSDKTMVVWQPSTDTMWEFWLTKKRADGWHARWGGRMKNVSANPGYYENPRNWGATATSLPMLGGLIRLDELRAGKIEHALAICLPETRRDWHSWPAQRTDGTVDREDAVPEGTRFRLDPKLDLSKLPMSRTTRMIAVAAQKYGMVVRDRGGAIAFYAEDPTPGGSNPYAGATGFFEGKYPSQLLEHFPWKHLQALRAELRRNGPG